jgi:uncharacterized protein
VRPILIIFAKAPRMGLAKTRLAVGIGPVRAWRTKRRLDALTCRIATDPRWTTFLAVSPDRDIIAPFPNVWPAHIRRLGQGKGDLGQRMARALGSFGQVPVIVIGSDAPDLRTQDIQDGFSALKGNHVVFGPALDGGFWLVGYAARFSRHARFGKVRWSSQHALEDSLSALPRDWKVAMLRLQADVDDIDSLNAASSKRR